ncbi:helix-turn-helix domain-containing protein [Acinetobacter baumannii]|uniref:Helix-turn-helix domain-containing protein n=1 Tax=Acinetobacter baumannii TaxID=470 RepID=A0A246A705_ACIBA|nr:helix-turn-helix domain-containing protein [Acinetobacter baumannii]OWK68436.1 peptidase S24 [Acinetobacter baumannii]QCP31945.1 helix-turn-helix domain-containing protein [Acinetobacter baumannii]QTH55102.1 helix-turn-helix domain-containing protein [Acinetobacter baumannii]QTK44451.1 helix-turn-helix domain-containing protein [Acinetobacter baumannii]
MREYLVSIGQRISKLMLDMDVSNAKLARMIGVSRPTIGNWIEGKSAPTGENLTNLANALKVDPNWLMSGKESQVRLDNNVDVSQKIPFDGHPIPVISWVAAGSFEPIETVLRDAEVDEYLPPIKECGRNGYGLIVTGISMLPKFEPEDRIYVNPDFQVSDLKTGDLVIVSCTGDNEATFKQLIIEGTTKYLKPLNPKWDEQIIKLTEDCRLVGKVVGLYRKI